MKNKFRNTFAMSMTLTLSWLIALGCDGGAKERAVFAQNMTAPSEGLTASTSGTSSEILVIQISGPTPSRPENLIRDERLTQLRNKGFKRVEVRGSDDKIMWEKTLE